MNVQKRPSVTNEFGEEIFHDGRASFDIRPFLPYLQAVIDVWEVDEDTSEAIVDSILNPSASVDEHDHWITLAELLVRWRLEPRAGRRISRPSAPRRGLRPRPGCPDGRACKPGGRRGLRGSGPDQQVRPSRVRVDRRS